MNGRTERFERIIDGIRYRVARREDLDAIWALMLSDFYPHTPVYAHLGYSKPEDVAQQLALPADLLEQGVTLVAEDAASGALVGARVSSLVPRKSAKRHPLVLDAFKFLVVRKQMRSRRIATHLVEGSLELAKLRGVPLVSAIAAHRHSEPIFESLGFERVQSLTLADYVDPVVGDRPFEGLDPKVLREQVLLVKRV